MTLKRKRFLGHPYTVVASCDAAYFHQFAPALMMSAIKTKTPLHIHIVNPYQAQIDEVNELMERSALLSFSWMKFDLNGLTDIQRKVLYASERYAVGTEILDIFGGIPDDEPTTGVLILDIDSIINRPIEWTKFATAQLGIWDRRSEKLGSNDIERRGMKVIACMYCDYTAVSVLEDIYLRIENENFGYWFLDQIAVHDAWMKAIDDGVSWFDMKDKGIIDWTFNDASYIWTGKGNRKFTDQKYVDRVTSLNDEFRRWRYEE